MPLDVLKTKMQGIEAKQLYSNSIDCLVKTVKNEGVLALWKGATPRLGRLIVSTLPVFFSVYGLWGFTDSLYVLVFWWHCFCMLRGSHQGVQLYGFVIGE
jgi:hypothetical protein